MPSHLKVLGSVALLTQLFWHTTSMTVVDPLLYTNWEQEGFVRPASQGFYEFRAYFGSKPGVTVQGWPKKGGFYILDSCLGLELDFLGLDRFNSTKRPSPCENGTLADEEEHCNKSTYY